MSAIYIVTLLVLIGSDALPSKVHAGSSKSSDSRDSSKSVDSRNDDEHQCTKAVSKQEAVQNKIKYLQDKKQPLPTCTCGTSGTISKIDIFNANSRKTTTLLTCSGCTGPHVPVTSAAQCKNVPDIFGSDLEDFCQIVHPRCKNVTVYRCGSPAVSTTGARTSAILSTTSFTETPRPTSIPLQTTSNVPQSAVTIQGNPTAIPPSPTPFLGPGFGGYTYY